MKQKLSHKILHHLKYGKTADGQVGCRVSLADSKNSGWLSIKAKKHYDSRFEPVREDIIGYEVEYIELNENYDEERDGMDFDLFLIKRESYTNIKDVNELERIISKWVDDFSIIEPISNVSHPMH